MAVLTSSFQADEKNSLVVEELEEYALASVEVDYEHTE